MWMKNRMGVVKMENRKKITNKNKKSKSKKNREEWDTAEKATEENHMGKY